MRSLANTNVEPQHGFSLIELLVVVAVILALAAIAIPNLLRSKIAANEASAVSTLRQISSAEVAYRTTYDAVGFSPDLPSLGGPANGCSPSPATACIVDSVITTGNKSGYRFFAAGFAPGGSPTNTQFVASAAPQAFDKSGVKNFCVATDDGTLRVNPGAPGMPPAPDVPTCLAYSTLQ
jgi:prepilin-type N-terminal cleavage/methylation domain-containing protein